MEPTQQQSGTTRTARQAGKVTPSPIVHARDLVASVIAKSGQKLFGATATFGSSSFRGEATISGGNVAAFLQERINYFGLDGITVPASAKHLDDAIMAVAAQVAQKCGTKGELNADQVERITLEYVTSSCFCGQDQVESFASYLDRSRKMRVAIKDVNAAAQASSQEAFAKEPTPAITQAIEAGGRAWSVIGTLLAQSRHLRTLRTTIVSPILYASVEAWKTVQAIDQRTRQAVLAELTAMIGENGNPFVAEAEIARASARVQGNLLLSSGTQFGVSATTVIRALEQTRRAQVLPNGGSRVELKGATPADIGRQIAGLNGGIDVVVERKDDQTLAMQLTVREGPPMTSPFTAMVPAPGASRQSAAYAS
ncbi:MAG: hypothetical protein Q7R80_04805 [bacterium]|nr:hypothetical protein [bacterium]